MFVAREVAKKIAMSEGWVATFIALVLRQLSGSNPNIAQSQEMGEITKKCHQILSLQFNGNTRKII